MQATAGTQTTCRPGPRRAARTPGLWTALLVAGLSAAAPAAGAHPGAGITVLPGNRVVFVDGVRNRLAVVDAQGKISDFFVDAPEHPVQNPHHLVHDARGFLYTTGDGSNPVWKIGPDGRATAVTDPKRLSLPISDGGDPFTVDAQGLVIFIVMEQFRRSELLRQEKDGRQTSLAGGAWGFADGKGKAARFRSLHSAAFAWGPGGVLYLTDDGRRVRRVARDGTVTTLAGGDQEGYAEGDGASARFHSAAGLAVDGENNLIVADTGNHRIRKVAPDGTVSTVAGSGREGTGDGPARFAAFSEPTGVAVGGDGSIFVLDWVADDPRVRKISPDGMVTTLARLP